MGPYHWISGKLISWICKLSSNLNSFCLYKLFLRSHRCHQFCSVCSSQSEAFQLPISPSLSLSHTLHFLTILGLAIYYMLCTLLVVSILKEAGYICVCIHAVDLEFQWLSTLRYNTSHSHLLLTLISCTLLHLRILYYMYSWLQKEAGLETICTVEVLGAPWLYCVFWFTELVHSVVCGEWLQSYSTCLSPIPQQLAEVLILAISARELTFYRGAEANYAPTPGMGMPGVEAGRP